jgi:tripartite-type tricarboxylate transporter receptor subunit TctC
MKVPALPTLPELGYAQIEADNWYGMVAAGRTPPAIVARLNAAAKVVQTAGIKVN